MRKKFKLMPLAASLIAGLVLSSCTKEWHHLETSLDAYHTLKVEQIKDVVFINVIPDNPRPYVRIATVETQFGTAVFRTRITIDSASTKGFASFSINAKLTGYKIYSFQRLFL